MRRKLLYAEWIPSSIYLSGHGCGLFSVELDNVMIIYTFFPINLHIMETFMGTFWPVNEYVLTFWHENRYFWVLIRFGSGYVFSVFNINFVKAVTYTYLLYCICTYSACLPYPCILRSESCIVLCCSVLKQEKITRTRQG